MSVAIIVMVIVLVAVVAALTFIVMMRTRSRVPHGTTGAKGRPEYVRRDSQVNYYRPSDAAEGDLPEGPEKEQPTKRSSDPRDVPLPRCPGCGSAISYDQSRCPKCGLVLKPL